MKAIPSRMPEQDETQSEGWPRKVQPGRAVVRVYRRKTPSENFAYMVANYADGETRRFDSYASEADAIDAATALAKRLDKRDYVAAAMTKEQALDYASADESLKPYDISVSAGASALAGWLKTVGDLANVHAAVKFYKERHKTVTKKSVPEVVTEFLKVKGNRGASERYIDDLTGRLKRFETDCNKDCCNVTTADLQDWLDGLELAPQSYRNYRTVLHTLFTFAVAKGYAVDNPVEGVEKLKVRNGEVAIFKPGEIARLLDAARVNYPDFLPCLAIGAFAGLRSAEIERLDWQEVDLKARHIVVSAGKAKTASRRIVPISDNLAAWLATYSAREGKVWTESSVLFYKRQESVAAATAVKAEESKGIKAEKPVQWKGNGLRHSYASYRFAQTSDAGRVAGELGNSAAVVHRHYRELVKPADAERWFNLKPEAPTNLLPMPATASA